MDQAGQSTRGADDGQDLPRTDTALLIAISFFENAQLVAPVIESLITCADDIAAVGGELVCYNDSPGHVPLAAALAEQLARAAPHIACRLENNSRNLGFVRTMNRAAAEAVARRTDLLLLNSDTVLTPGALTEMVAVAGLDHMIGFVNPRSNNATLATLPVRDSSGARAPWQALAALLPRYRFVPTAVGFCLLVRWNILAEFGGFDEVYGQGYNEENDLVMRAGRCGYRAVLANHAFVWHEGERSFATAAIHRDGWEPVNRAILDARYPEYSAITHAHYDAPETLAEPLLAATLPDAAGKLDIAFDFSSFRAAHNGTFEAGRQVLQAAAQVWGDATRLHVLCGPEVYDFHGYAALGIPRADPHGDTNFAAIFRVGQPYDWNVLERLVARAAVLGIYMLDTISIDCPQLASPLLYDIWQLTLDHADLVAVQSTQTSGQLQRRFHIPPSARMLVCPHGLDLAEYRLPGATGAPPPGTGRVLVLGNHFHHKYLNPTANALAAALPDRVIVAMGPDRRGAGRVADPSAPVPFIDTPNLHIVDVGRRPDAEIGAQYDAADIVIFPSHAEGFGFPLLHALAAGRPVFVRRLPVFTEIHRALNETPNLHFYDTTDELIARLRHPPAWVPFTPPTGNGAARAARDIHAALREALGRVDYERIVRRIRAVRMVSALATQNAPAPPSDTKAAEAARYIALRVERVALHLLQSRPVYTAARWGWRVARRR